MILGLTGGIASGKSTVAKIFQKLGLEVIDADLLAKEVRDSPNSLNEIEKVFGKEVFSSEQKLNIEKLRELVFSDKDKLNSLNEIVHPLVVESFKKFKEEALKNNKTVVFDIPLLFESNLEYLCDKILVVYTSYENQIKRVKERDHLEEELVKKIINSQMNLDLKLKKADYTIENSGSFELLEKKIKNLYMLLNDPQ